ncbi:dolichyl-diphosphooligosaccharide--protein glycosyltransferase subunit 1-like [Bos javanicus]|uniref:dolichyl-diphosphooligosaccharide--protein glycosyltransferase subunit 1-like n=1 Tax=Bos javanicus TaxID=9906 RepID=UPI002AA92294|nr:dolichyl-diphosphooligosaccharide--protein glycosyltransferase subunit 1-like [Bos javanicus]
MEAPAVHLLPLLLLFAAWAPEPGSTSAEAPPLVNEEVRRTVDLSSHLAKVTAEVVLAHTGSDSSPRAVSFLVALEPEFEAQLAHLGVQVTGVDEEANSLEVQETKINGKSGRFFTVQLPVALDPGAEVSVVVEAVYTHAIQPYPIQITQSQKQFVVFEGNHYFYSPYPTKTQTMHVKLASPNVESYTKLGNPMCHENLLDYGPFHDIPAYSQDSFKVHSENNSPFLTVTSMTRVIEVSHWGNIAVEENVNLKHTGAVLKGSFSRYDYDKWIDSGISSIRSFKTILPASAQDVYYRDEIGSIYTRHLLILDDSVEMEMKPRFPLFGGWKTHYIIGYNLPSYEYLYNLGDQYVLKMRLVDHVFDKQLIDSLTVKIILPEGARNIQVDSPYEISRAPDELYYTYLDTFGRPVIVAHKKNLVEQHIQDIVVHYTFSKVLMLQEPLLLVATFSILFFTVVIYVRLDLSITKDPAAEARMKVACIIEQVLTLVSKRLGLYHHFNKTVNRYKQSRDVSVLNSGKKSLEMEHKALTSEVALLQARLKTEGSNLCDKVSEMQKLDTQVKQLVLKSAVEAEWLVAGKLKKDMYIQNKKLISGKRQELVSKIEHILDTL